MQNSVSVSKVSISALYNNITEGIGARPNLVATHAAKCWSYSFEDKLL